MIGDGVNDILSLKRANLGIAMQSGSPATRGVADMVLIDDSFASLPPAFLEGQRIVNGMRDILRLFLTRSFYFALLILATAIIGIGFPYVPKHAALLVFLTVGVPTFALATWARPGINISVGIIRDILHFVIPAAVFTFLFGLFVYILAYGLATTQLDAKVFNVSPEQIENFQEITGITYIITSTEDFKIEVATIVAQTALTIFTLLAGLLLVLFVEPPDPIFTGGDELSGDKRPVILVAGMFFAFLIVMLYPPLREFFELIILPTYAYLAIIFTVFVWALILRHAWRARWFERFLRLDTT
jgi:cation-transporting ATPase E